jgi:hypothetical protein
MRVLFWSGLFWPYIGGPEVLAADLLPALPQRGYQLAVVTSHDSLDLPDETAYRRIYAAELAAASVALLAEPARMAEMGRTARRRAETLFAWDHDALYARLAVARRAAIRMPGPEGGPAISPKAGAGA